MVLTEARILESESDPRPSDLLFTDSYWWTDEEESCEAGQPGAVLDTVPKPLIRTVGNVFNDGVRAIANGHVPCLRGLEALECQDFEPGTMLLIDVEKLRNNALAYVFEAGNWEYDSSPERQDLLFQLPTLDFLRCSQANPENVSQPGQVVIPRSYLDAEVPNQFWEYRRTAWFGIVAPTKYGRKLVSFEGLASKNMPPSFRIVSIEHDNREAGKTTYRKRPAGGKHMGSQNSLERIKAIYAYDTAHLWEKVEQKFSIRLVSALAEAIRTTAK